MRAAAHVVLLTTAMHGCRSEPPESGRSDPPEPVQRYTTEQEAGLISVAREAALGHGWILEDCIYSVRPEGNGWIVIVDRAPGYKGEGEPSVVIDGTFFVHINAEGKATRLLSYGEDVDLAPPAADSHN
jgi:hypothetical protein